jgi:small subunit ribosomal protein S6
LLEVTNLETAVKKLYEGMFLIDSAEAAKDWDGIIETITKMLTKIDGEIVSIRKWDERPLAYKIRKCERGTYILTYFRAEGPRIHELERDVELSEKIIRAMILNAEHLADEDLTKDTPAQRIEKQNQQPAAEEAATEEAVKIEEQTEAASTETSAGEEEPAEEPKTPE